MPKVIVDYDDCSLMWKCPGCQLQHIIYFDPETSPCWHWNNNVESPTITPSVRVRWTYGDPLVNHTCHFFITDGVIKYLNDCTHKYSGMSVAMLLI